MRTSESQTSVFLKADFPLHSSTRPAWAACAQKSHQPKYFSETRWTPRGAGWLTSWRGSGTLVHVQAGLLAPDPVCVSRAGQGMRRHPLGESEVGIFPSWTLCTSPLSPDIWTQSSVHLVPRWPGFTGLSHLTRARSRWKKSCTFTLQRKDWLQAFPEANCPTGSPSITSSRFEPKMAPLIRVFSTLCPPLPYFEGQWKWTWGKSIHFTGDLYSVPPKTRVQWASDRSSKKTNLLFYPVYRILCPLHTAHSPLETSSPPCFNKGINSCEFILPKDYLGRAGLNKLSFAAL